ARLPVETVVGVVFSGALALGSLMTSGDELIQALLGKPTQLGSAEFVIHSGGDGQARRGRPARNVAVAVLLAVTSTALGTWIGAVTGGETGPHIVLVAVAFFLLSLCKRAFV
ncbi:MAG TPA: metal ABC transporter permease, partial [Myxococcota bacterium]|nr:metal ABC transporter permease [Myxococcota bacterium]